MPGARQQGLNPGGIEAIKQSIQLLIQKGVEPEQIVEILVGMIQMAGLDIPPEAIQQLVMQIAGGANVQTK
jgi:hypothetical protein